DRNRIDHFAQYRFNQLSEDEGWNHIEEYVQYQDNEVGRTSTSEYVLCLRSNKAYFRRTVEEGSKAALLPHNTNRAKDIKKPIAFLSNPCNIREEPNANTRRSNFRYHNQSRDHNPRPPYPTPSNVNDTGITNEEIHVNLPFLEAMIHMPKGAKVLKDLLSHKEKLEKAASLVKLSEECLAVIQRSLPQKEGDLGSFTLPCLIGPLTVKNALADLRANINHMPHSLFLRLVISKLKPTKMSIKLVDRLIKYPVSVYENLLIKINKFIFPVNFVVLEMDEDDMVPIILGRSFLAIARVMIDVHEGKLSLRVGKETVTFNIGKSIKSTYTRDDYLYCTDHTAKLIQEKWVDAVDHNEKWVETEEERNSEDVLAVSFYLKQELFEPLKWKVLENRLKPSATEPPKLELRELPEHLEYASLQDDDQLLVVISSALSAHKKTKLLEEFDIKIRDKKGAKNLAADHLSRLENPDLGKLTKAEIRDLFPEEQLMTIFNKRTEPPNRYPVSTSSIHIKSCKSPTTELFDVDSGRISIVTVNTEKYHSDVLARSQE
ncbi:DNA-directed DNA polymerase, partial [Tanacetum coccineum]